MMPFTVTRQRQWPDGTLCVEISQGDLNYTNPDALAAKFRKLGEFETFTSMTPAVMAGIAIYNAWKATTTEPIGIAVGFTGGNTMPFDGQELTDDFRDELLAKAKEFDENIPRCAECGEIFPNDDRYGMWWQHCDDRDCCSEFCAEKHHQADVDELIGTVD